MIWLNLGLWEPYELAGTPDEKIREWGKVSYDYFLGLNSTSDAGTAGVQVLSLYELFTADDRPDKYPTWKDVVLHFRDLCSEELRAMNLPSEYISGFSYTTMVVDQRYYMEWLHKKLLGYGISFQLKKIALFDDLSQEYDVVLNCTGLGAAFLSGDNEMYPIRGQVLRVKAPWIKNVWIFGQHYLIPQLDTVVVGGTAQKGSWDESVSEEDTEKILGACRVFPSLRTAPIESVSVGLRPGRTSLRLDSEMYHCKDGIRKLPVVHCYGHGGSGVTLSYGTASDAVINHLIPTLAKLNEK